MKHELLVEGLERLLAHAKPAAFVAPFPPARLAGRISVLNFTLPFSAVPTKDWVANKDFFLFF